jgi:putative efflux protein, MATE family
VGEVELGASAIGGVFYFAIFMIGFGFSQGAQILIGRRNGEENYLQIGSIFNNALVFNILLSILIFFLSLKGVPVIMKLAVSSSEVYKASLAYLDWRIYGYIFAFANAVFRAYYVGITQTKILTSSAIVMAVANILGDYVLIFGHFGVPKLGIEGAGISSVIAEIITLIYVIFYTIARADMKKYGLFRFRKIELKIVLQILELSVFIMFQYFISISTWFMFFIFIEHMGERPLAVSNIGRSLYILLMIPASALATTANTVVSNLIGAERKEDVLPFVHRLMRMSILFVLPFAAITIVYPQYLAHIYTDDPYLIVACIPTIRIIALANVLFAASFVVFNAVSGTGNTRTAFAIEFITLFFYIGYVYYTAIVNPSTVSVVWLSEFVYWIIIGSVGYIYLWKGNWRKKVI